MFFLSWILWTPNIFLAFLNCFICFLYSLYILSVIVCHCYHYYIPLSLSLSLPPFASVFFFLHLFSILLLYMFLFFLSLYVLSDFLVFALPLFLFHFLYSFLLIYLSCLPLLSVCYFPHHSHFLCPNFVTSAHHFFVIFNFLFSSLVSLLLSMSFIVSPHILTSYTFLHHYLSITHHCFPSFHVYLYLCISLSFSFSFTIFLPTEQEDESSALRVDNDKVRADLHLTKLRLLAELDACHVQSATYFPLFSSIAGSSILNTCTLCWKIYQECSTGGVWDSNGFAH